MNSLHDTRFIFPLSVFTQIYSIFVAWPRALASARVTRPVFGRVRMGTHQHTASKRGPHLIGV